MLISLIKLIAILSAASLIGNWFLAELKKVKSLGKPWHHVYRTVPGILMIIALLGLPLIVWIGRH
jgi:hypothetical protein